MESEWSGQDARMRLVLVALNCLHEKSKDPNVKLLARAYSQQICTVNWSYEDFLQKPGMMPRLILHALDFVPIDQARDGDICEDVREDLIKTLD